MIKMEELIDVLDESGNKTGKTETRDKVHEKGLWHRIIVVSFIDSDGHLLMQQRSFKKEINSGKWDISTAGHVSSGQTSIEAAVRKVSEELGIKIDGKELKYILTYRKSAQTKAKYIDKEIYDCYIVNKEEININDIKIEESEVEQVKLCKLSEFKELLEDKKLMDREELYNELIKYLK